MTVAGDTGSTKPAGNVTDTLEPATNAPDADDVNPTVHVAPVAPPDCGAPANVIAVGAVAGAITTGADGDAVAASGVVATVKPAAGFEPAVGFVIPAITTEAAAPFANVHVGLSTNETVTV